MYYKKIITILSMIGGVLLPFALKGAEETNIQQCPIEGNHTLSKDALANALNWVNSQDNRCGGYYLEAPFTYSDDLLKKDLIHITSDQGLFSLHGTSIGQGKVTITRYGQQIIANKAYLYRDPVTGKYSAVDLMDHVVLREPNHMVLAKCGHFDLKTKYESLQTILYRTAIYANAAQSTEPLSNEALQVPRKVEAFTAWGEASWFDQDQPKIYHFKNASYTTCPPKTSVWKLKASEINLDKNTGRGSAKHARILIKDVPVLYAPYFNFPIDDRRQTGFLSPTPGHSSNSGNYFQAPFYWNIAPNYDMTITPAYLSLRGLELSDYFRYLTPKSTGAVNISILPDDQDFRDFQAQSLAQYQSNTNPVVQSELNRLENSSTTRRSLIWKDKTQMNDHWSSDVDFSYVSDDYFLRDITNNANEVTQNQLLQQGEIKYQGEHWNLLSRIQAYQTLHPIDETEVDNQYIRLPQIALEGNYSDTPGGFTYFISNDLTNFQIRKNPGATTLSPIGDRLNVQPGIAWPFRLPYFYITPRLQYALTQYELKQVTAPSPANPGRSLPIVDIHSGLYFDRDFSLFHHAYRQTLEPEVYYAYIPYRDQSDIPIFDTTENMLTYDELFTYNRFSGLDRIGDTNQISAGITTRLIDSATGLEKFSAGIGEIFYFENRRVTLCTLNNPCSPNPENSENQSPLSGVLRYNLNPTWSLKSDSIWNPSTSELDNQTFTVQYLSDPKHVINFSYSFVRGGDEQLDDDPNSSSVNLSQTDLSFAWPLTRDWSAVGRWTQNWNHNHFQNLLYGLQYDSCCWAVRFVAGREFTNLSANNTYQYDTQFMVQFALKGLGNFGTKDPSQLLSNITGYQNNFGRDF